MKIANIPVSLHFSLLATLLAAIIVTSAPAQAGNYYRTQLSDVLASRGLDTLLLALDTAHLTDALDKRHVTLFAPTNDVFDELASALGCSDAVALATGLSDLGLLDDVLTYHVVNGRRGKRGLVKNGDFHTLLGADVSTGVNANGLFVRGVGNSTNSTITVEGIWGRKFVIYTIDQILLPIPEGDVVASAKAICP